VTIKRPYDARFVVEKVIGVQRLVTNEVIDTAPVFLASALGHQINQGPAVVTILCSVVVAQDLDFSNGVLIDGHA